MGNNLLIMSHAGAPTLKHVLVLLFLGSSLKTCLLSLYTVQSLYALCHLLLSLGYNNQWLFMPMNMAHY